MHPPAPPLPARAAPSRRTWGRCPAALLLAALLLASPGGPARAGRPGGDAPATIVFCCPEAGWPPYLLPCNGSDCRGIMPEIFREAMRSLGVTVVTRSFPEKRSLVMLRQGEVDVYSKAPEWVEDSEAFLWSAPVLPSRDVLVAPAGGRPIDGPQDLTGLRLGTVLGYSYPGLDEALASGRVTRDDAPDTASQLRKLLYGRTGAAVVNELVARWVLRGLHEPGADSLRFSERSVGLAWMRFGFTRARDWRALVGRLDAEIERMRADGRLQAIVDTYR